MTPTLPLELQLHIFELALPPLIRRNLDERVRLCKAFSLVHRSWTKTAQRELHEHLSVTYTQLACLDKAAQERIVAAREGGWPLKRMDVHLEAITNAISWLGQRDRVDWGALEEMWLTLHEGDLTSFGVTSLHRLHLYDEAHRDGPALFRHLPRQLTYLSLHLISLSEFTSFDCLPALEVLILDAVQDAPDWSELGSTAGIRILGCKSKFPIFAPDTLASMPQLQHFIVVFDRTSDAAVFWPALFELSNSHTSPVRLPQHLHTFTCLATKHDPVPDDQPAWTSLKTACDELGAVLDIRLGLTTREVDNFDLEEWA